MSKEKENLFGVCDFDKYRLHYIITHIINKETMKALLGRAMFDYCNGPNGTGNEANKFSRIIRYYTLILKENYSRRI